MPIRPTAALFISKPDIIEPTRTATRGSARGGPLTRLILIVATLTLTSAAKAETRAQGRPGDCAAQLLFIDGTEAHVPIPVLSDHPTVIRFDHRIIKHDMLVSNTIEASSLGDMIFIFPLPPSKPGDTIDIKISTEQLTVHLRVQVVAEIDDAQRLIAVKKHDGAARSLPPITCLPADIEATATMLYATNVLIDDMLTNYERIPIPEPERLAVVARSSDISVRASAWVKTRRHRFLLFETENRDDQPHTIDAIRVANEWLQVNPAYGSSLKSKPIGSTPLVLHPGEHAKGWIWLREPNNLGAHVSLMIDSDADRERPITQNHIPVIDLTSFKSPEELAEEKRQKSARRTTLHAQLLGGVTWIRPPISVEKELQAASMKGVGIRVSKGMHPIVAAEVEANIASSSDAEFDSIMIDGVEGNLRRNVTMTRVRTGAMFRLGEHTIPTLRAGLGAQFTSYKEAFSDFSGAPLPTPDTPLEFNVFLYVGLGMEIRLNNHVIAGASVSAEERLTGRTLHADIYLGYTLDD